MADNSPKSHNFKEGGSRRIAMKRSKFWRILFSPGSPKCRRVSACLAREGAGRGYAEAVQDAAWRIVSLGETERGLKRMVKGNFAHYF